LANLSPPHQANPSTWAFPRSCAFKEAIGKAQFSTLPSSPTVSGRFVRQGKVEAYGLVKRGD
jgi:hypothetical protein